MGWAAPQAPTGLGLVAPVTIQNRVACFGDVFLSHLAVRNTPVTSAVGIFWKLSQDVVAGEEGSELKTRPGTVLGTVGYMSPEQAGGRDVDFRSDQFSYGAVVYEMLTGKRAFERATGAETLTAIIREAPVPITDLKGPSVPPFLLWIVERCLEKDPEDRYASTRDLASELQGLREHSSDDFALLAAPDLTSLRRRERLAWAAAGILFLVSLAAFLIIYFRGATAIEALPIRFFVSPPEKWCLPPWMGLWPFRPTGAVWHSSARAGKVKSFSGSALSIH